MESDNRKLPWRRVVLALMVMICGTWGIYWACQDWITPAMVRHGIGPIPFREWTAKPASQHLSDQVAQSLHVAPVLITAENIDGFYARTWCDPKQDDVAGCHILLSEAADLASANDPGQVRAMIAHEYGHVALHGAGQDPGSAWYFLPYLLMLGAEILLCIFWIPSWTLRAIPIGCLLFAVIFYPPMIRDYFLVSVAAVYVVVGVGTGVALQAGSRQNARKRFGFSMAALLALFLIGVTVRTPAYMRTEIYSDGIAVKVVGKEQFGSLLCTLRAQDDTASLSPALKAFNQWYDTHPTPAGRAAAQGFQLGCSPAVAGLEATNNRSR